MYDRLEQDNSAPYIDRNKVSALDHILQLQNVHCYVGRRGLCWGSRPIPGLYAQKLPLVADLMTCRACGCQDVELMPTARHFVRHGNAALCMVRGSCRVALLPACLQLQWPLLC